MRAPASRRRPRTYLPHEPITPPGGASGWVWPVRSRRPKEVGCCSGVGGPDRSSGFCCPAGADRRSLLGGICAHSRLAHRIHFYGGGMNKPIAAAVVAGSLLV